TGEVMAPRGVGTMLAMFVVGRLVQRVDLRALMALGFGLTAVSLYQMATITPQMDSHIIVVSGFIQGVGMGFTFVPLSTAAFATLDPALRHDGTPFYSLVRNIGSSVGISIVQTLYTHHLASAHADLAAGAHLSALAGSTWDPDRLAAVALLNAEVTRQASLLAYIADFRFMFIVTLAAMPLLLLIRRSRRPGDVEDSVAFVE
ncbi:MAG: EmrB/QacA family drug resistance transporter, partial [Burkholderiales bacterium]|nr:EmrB/QacA family drug resistance transporter [Burkholderiales bacterium]